MRCTKCQAVIVGNGLCLCPRPGPRWYHWLLLVLCAVAIAIITMAEHAAK